MARDQYIPFLGLTRRRFAIAYLQLVRALAVVMLFALAIGLSWWVTRHL